MKLKKHNILFAAGSEDTRLNFNWSREDRATIGPLMEGLTSEYEGKISRIFVKISGSKNKKTFQDVVQGYLLDYTKSILRVPGKVTIRVDNSTTARLILADLQLIKSFQKDHALGKDDPLWYSGELPDTPDVVKDKEAEAAAATAAAETTYIQDENSTGGSKTTTIIIVATVIVVVGALAFFLLRKK